MRWVDYEFAAIINRPTEILPVWAAAHEAMQRNGCVLQTINTECHLSPKMTGNPYVMTVRAMRLDTRPPEDWPPVTVYLDDQPSSL